jgi:single-strand DNA-binding protein
MSANNQVVLVGRVGNSPSEDTKTLQSGVKVSDVRLAVNRTTKDANGNPVTDWITCQAWDKQAERLAEWVSKGDLIAVSGSMRIDTWEKDGEKRNKAYVHVENFQMLESRAAREERNAGGGSSGGGQRQAQRPAAKPAPVDDFDDDGELPPF